MRSPLTLPGACGPSLESMVPRGGTTGRRSISSRWIIFATARLGGADSRLGASTIDWCITNARFASAFRLRRHLADRASAATRAAFGRYAATVRAHAKAPWPGEGDPLTLFHPRAHRVARPAPPLIGPAPPTCPRRRLRESRGLKAHAGRPRAIAARIDSCGRRRVWKGQRRPGARHADHGWHRAGPAPRQPASVQAGEARRTCPDIAMATIRLPRLVAHLLDRRSIDGLMPTTLLIPARVQARRPRESASADRLRPTAPGHRRSRAARRRAQLR